MEPDKSARFSTSEVGWMTDIKKHLADEVFVWKPFFSKVDVAYHVCEPEH